MPKMPKELLDKFKKDREMRRAAAEEKERGTSTEKRPTGRKQGQRSGESINAKGRELRKQKPADGGRSRERERRGQKTAPIRHQQRPEVQRRKNKPQPRVSGEREKWHGYQGRCVLNPDGAPRLSKG